MNRIKARLWCWFYCGKYNKPSVTWTHGQSRGKYFVHMAECPWAYPEL